MDQESTPQKSQDHELKPADEGAGSDGSVPSNVPTVAGEALGNFGFPGTPGAPPGAAWPGAAVPQRKRRRGLLLGVVAVVAAVVAGGVTGTVLILSKGETPTAMAQQAG